MIKKVLLLFVFTAVSLFAINFQTASKEELMSIKGIGPVTIDKNKRHLTTGNGSGKHARK